MERDEREGDGEEIGQENVSQERGGHRRSEKIRGRKSR